MLVRARAFTAIPRMNILDVYPDQYQQLLEQKVQQTRDNFAALQIPEIKVFASERQHYRMRAEFTVFHEGSKNSVGDSYYCMFDWPQPADEAEGAEAEAIADTAPPEEAEAACKRAKTEAGAGAVTQRKLTKKEKRKMKKMKEPAAPKKERVRVERFPRASERINELMPQVTSLNRRLLEAVCAAGAHRNQRQ